MLTDKGLTMNAIAAQITEEFGGEMHVIYTDDNAENLVLRVRHACLGLTLSRHSVSERSAALQLSRLISGFGPVLPLPPQ